MTAAELAALAPATPPPTARSGPTLDALRPGAGGVVTFVEAPPRERRRLLEMGFVPGTVIRVVRLAPLGDPMEVELHGYHLSLRRHQAGAVYLRDVDI